MVDVEVVRVSEHVMVRDYERRLLLCAVCKTRWPCAPKAAEILAKIKQQAEAKQA